MGSTAPCKAGPHVHLDEEPGRLEHSKDDEEMMKMEILLGMTQEEGIQCLLCLMPRCLCHINLELTKLDLKLRKLESGGEEQAVDMGALDEGNPSGPLESEGLTSPEEGSFTPQGPTGGPDSVCTLEQELEKEDEGTSTLEQELKEEEEVRGPVEEGLKVEEEASEEGGEQEPDRKGEGDKVTSNNLLVEMRKRMEMRRQDAEKLEEHRRKKKTAAQKRKEDDRKKEDRKQAENNRSVKEMLRMWSKDDRKETPGSILTNTGLARRMSGREEGRILTGT